MLDEQGDRSLFLAPETPSAPPDPARSAPAAEPPAGPAAPLVEVEGGRRRWLAVLVVVALLVAGVVANRRTAGEVGDDGAVDDPSPRDEGGGGAGEPAPTLAVLAPSLRTIDRSGPVLPEPTGTALVLGASTQVVVLDVDSGTVRRVHVADLEVGSSHPWGAHALPVGDDLVVRSHPPRSVRLPRADGEPVTALDAGSGGGLYPSDEQGRYWVEERRGDARLEEVDVTGAVSRSLPVLDGAGSIVQDGPGFLQSAGDGVLRTDPDGTVSEPIATGTAIAADRATLAVLRCPAGPDCDLELVDRATGAARPVPPAGGATGFRLDAGGELSSDGRWLLVAVVREGEDAAALAVVDVATGRVRAVEPPGAGQPPAGAFSPDGRWLFLTRSATSVRADVAAVDLAGGDRTLLAEVALRAGFGILLEAVPSSPLDLGGDGP